MIGIDIMRNEKGFAATGILYTILVLFILIMFSMLKLLNSRNDILNRIQDEVEGKIHEQIKPNLVLNGDLSFGDNTNFSSFTYSEDASSGYLSYVSNSSRGLMSNEYIAVDTSKKYLLSMDLKSSNTTATYYAGLAEYDIDKKFIDAYNFMYISGSLTFLKKDLKAGDKIVYLDNVSGFKVTSGTPGYQRGFIFWNYKDSTGYQYPVETYSRNVIDNIYDYGSIDTVNNTITLRSAWTGDTIIAGTKLSQSNSGSTYNYSLRTGGTFPISWNTYSANISGVNEKGDVSHQTFRPGTVYVKPLILFNYNNTANTTVYVKNVSLKTVD